MADAVLACFDAKFFYSLWRPVTAIHEAASDGNSDTFPDPAWQPLLITPPHPEYVSGHSSISGSGAALLALYFGDETPIWFDSDVMPNVVRAFPSFSAVMDEIANARIFGGIHFRSACDDGRTMGGQVASFVYENSLQPCRGN